MTITSPKRFARSDLTRCSNSDWHYLLFEATTFHGTSEAGRTLLLKEASTVG
jgi:hypothetical protein